VDQQVTEGERARVAADGAAAGRTATRPPTVSACELQTVTGRFLKDRVSWQSLPTTIIVYKKLWDTASMNLALRSKKKKKHWQKWVCEIWGFRTATLLGCGAVNFGIWRSEKMVRSHFRGSNNTFATATVSKHDGPSYTKHTTQHTAVIWNYQQK